MMKMKKKMKMNKNVAVILLFIFGFSALAPLRGTAQEVVFWTSSNPVIKNKLQQNPDFLNNRSNKGNDTLLLPFFDDFSTTEIYPNNELWEDNLVYINSSLSIHQPTIGVATFDAINEKGEVYSQYGFNFSFVADYLTSKPIDLSEEGTENVFLSFFVQPQGIADAPEGKDSLVLEFWAVEEAQWISVWNKAGSFNTDFQQVILPVSDEKFLKKGFRFRFKNYVTYSGGTYLSQVTNADYWHIDYVRLDKNRSIDDLTLNDIAFTQPLTSLLNGYSSVPWNHFKTGNISLKQNIDVEYQNNDDINRTIDLRQFTLENVLNPSTPAVLDAGSDELTPNQNKQFSANHIFTFPSDNNDSANFVLSAILNTDEYDYEGNNTITYEQNFYNYYSYDDGTAEAGYGLVGTGSKNGKFAYRFDIAKEDTLQGLQMYFVQSYANSSQKYFMLTVWADNGGQPGDTLYTELGFLPTYENQLNTFHSYKIHTPIDTPLVVSGTFYIGWQQTTEDKLNIGLDLNNVMNQNMWYNVNGYWEQSSIEGAVMIRPILGEPIYENVVDVEDIPKNNLFIQLFPNPTNGIFKIKLPDSVADELYTITVYNMLGTQVFSENNYFSEKEIDLTNVPTGIYFVKLTDRNGISATTKLVIK